LTKDTGDPFKMTAKGRGEYKRTDTQGGERAGLVVWG